MEIAVSKSKPSHGYRQLVIYPDSDSNGESDNCKQHPILDEDFDGEIDLVLVSKEKGKCKFSPGKVTNFKY